MPTYSPDLSLSRYLEVARDIGMSYRNAATILVLRILTALFEGSAFAMMLPITEYIEHGGKLDDVDQSAVYWRILGEALSFAGLPVSLGSLLLVCFLLVLGRQAMNFTSVVYRAYVFQDLQRRIRNRAFEGAMTADTRVHDRLMTGDFVNKFMTETPVAVEAAYGYVDVLGNLFTVVFYICGLFLMSPEMTLICLVMNVVSALTLRFTLAKSRRLGAQVAAANGETGRFLVERLGSLRLIRLAGMESGERENIQSRTRVQFERLLSLIRTRALLSSFIEPIVVLIGFITIYVAVEHLGIEMSVLAVFILILLRLLPPIKMTLEKYQQTLARWASLCVVREQLREFDRSVEDQGGDRVLEALEESIRFENVSFRYDEDDVDLPALNGISVEIPAGSMTALVGPSGAGKSTFSDLLPRLRVPTGGRIELDGVPIEEYSVRSLRQRIVYVPQKPEIFNVSPAQHIGYGMTDASRSEIETAAELAGAAEFIRALPRGFDTLLGASGNRLSGGELQRLDLARALVRHATILVLDEPTSALDSQSEEKFRAALQRIRKHRKITLIIIAHRLSTIRDADQIVVFDRGRVASTGTHHDLMREGGWYATAHDLQIGPNSRSPAAAT